MPRGVGRKMSSLRNVNSESHQTFNFALSCSEYFLLTAPSNIHPSDNNRCPRNTIGDDAPQRNMTIPVPTRLEYGYIVGLHIHITAAAVHLVVAPLRQRIPQPRLRRSSSHVSICTGRGHLAEGRVGVRQKLQCLALRVSPPATVTTLTRCCKWLANSCRTMHVFLPPSPSYSLSEVR